MGQPLLSLSISVNSLGRAVLYSLRLPQAIETAEANGVENASLLNAYKVLHVLNTWNPRRLSSWHGWIRNAVFEPTFIPCPRRLGTVCVPKNESYFSCEVCAAMDMISEMSFVGETSLAFSSHGISFSTKHIADCGSKQQMSFKFLSWTLQETLPRA